MLRDGASSSRAGRAPWRENERAAAADDRDDGDDVAGAGATKREHEEANPAPPPSFAKLTKQQRKLKKPCIPRPNVD